MPKWLARSSRADICSLSDMSEMPATGATWVEVPPAKAGKRYYVNTVTQVRPCWVAMARVVLMHALQHRKRVGQRRQTPSSCLQKFFYLQKPLLLQVLLLSLGLRQSWRVGSRNLTAKAARGSSGTFHALSGFNCFFKCFHKGTFMTCLCFCVADGSS